MEGVCEAHRHLVTAKHIHIECALVQFALNSDCQLRSISGASCDNWRWMGGAYREIETNVRIAFDFAWLEAGTDPGARSLITVTFEAEADSTRQRFHQASFAAELNRDQHHEGWSECLDRLAQLFEPG